jgi:hypothetical protein
MLRHSKCRVGVATIIHATKGEPVSCVRPGGCVTVQYRSCKKKCPSRGYTISRGPTGQKEQKYGYGSRRDPEPRFTVLARASSNLLDWKRTSLERDFRQTHQSESVVRQAPLVEAWPSHCCKPLRGSEHGRWGNYGVGSRYETSGEDTADWEDLVRAIELAIAL